MRVVLFDHESMEPITVLQLPSWAYDMLRERRQVTFPVWLDLAKAYDVAGEVPRAMDIPKVTVWFEKFVRNEQAHWFCFTNDGENALKLKAAFLPGQYGEVQRRTNEAFLKGLLAGLKL